MINKTLFDDISNKLLIQRFFAISIQINSVEDILCILNQVKFPAKPYRSQVAMMSKIITSIQRSQNSLLESPTGSGKSLALLCASLAWQETETAKVDAFNSLRQRAIETQVKYFFYIFLES